MDPMRPVFLVSVAVVVMAVTVYGLFSTELIRGGMTGGEERADVIVNMTTWTWGFHADVVSGKELASSSSVPSEKGGEETLLKVKVGSRVSLRLTNLEENQPHGFSLQEFGVRSLTIAPKQTIETKFLADKEGSFTFICTVFCGTGHPRHKGVLIVER